MREFLLQSARFPFGREFEVQGSPLFSENRSKVSVIKIKDLDTPVAKNAAALSHFSETVEHGFRWDSVMTMQNFEPERDAESAFWFVDSRWSKDTVCWQEVAHRNLENIGAELTVLDKRVSDAKINLDNIQKAVNAYLDKDFNSGSLSTDYNYRMLRAELNDAQATYSFLSERRNTFAKEYESISSYIDPAMITTFKGFRGADFNSSYDAFLTEIQGRARPGFLGVCGIDETCSIVNQQLGTNMTESEGIAEYLEKGLCNAGGTSFSNGGTTTEGRKAFLESKGLTFEEIQGEYDTGVSISLEEVARRFNAGESAGIMLKAQDCFQPGLSMRTFDPNDPIGSMTNYFANHATTIAGFSYTTDGKVAGVWLNDTSGATGSNRIFIDTEKFDMMQKTTRGFAVEFSRAR